MHKTQESLVSENALRVLEKRYLQKDPEGQVVESPEAMFQRVAENIAKADLIYDGNADLTATTADFFQLMSDLKFLPNSPTLMNAGRELQQLSACFVLPVGDSIQEIFETIKQTAIIHQTGGGTGFSFSRIRPKGDRVRTTGGIASGPISFMRVFNHATEAIKQGGTRRGANMGILSVHHPDVLAFIRCKEDTSEITNFNLSVAITDAFMNAYKKDQDYDLINPRTGAAVQSLSARAVMNEIAKQAHKTGEPGLFFIDRANEGNATPHINMIEATNPCGEQPLLPYESCNLGSINLEKHLSIKTGKYQIDWPALEKSIRTAVHFLDNVIDMNYYPIEKIKEITKGNRKIGLGVMGFARMLFKLEIPYNSEKGIETAKEVMGFIHQTAYDSSARLADQRGVYPNWIGSLHEKRNQRVRNTTLTTIAPTGTLSMIANTSGGCEPEYSLIWHKNVMDGEHLPYVLEHFIEIAEWEGFWTGDLLEKIEKNKGSVCGIDQVPEHWQKVFVTAHDIDYKSHVRMQAAFQEYSDSAVSKTINLPPSATIQEVKEAYLLAYVLGCKGITVYRDGARADQVLNTGTNKKLEIEKSNEAQTLPDLIPELRIKVKTKRGNSYVHVGFLTQEEGLSQILKTLREQGRIRELFLSPSPHVKNRELLDMVCRLGSKLLRTGAPIEEVLEQLIKSNDQFGEMTSDAFALVKGLTTVSSQITGGTSMKLPCPECGSTPLRMQEGCFSCTRCAWSRC